MGPKRPAAFAKGPSKPKVPKSKGEFEGFFVVLDKQILDEEYGQEVTTKLVEELLSYEVRNQLIDHSISFERVTSEGRDEESVLILLLRGSDVISWIEDDVLVPTISSYTDTYPDKKISLLIHGFRRVIRAGGTKLSRMKIETELTRLQILTGISHRLIEKPDVFADTIIHFAKSVAQMPEKKRKNQQVDNERFYFENDNKDCVKVLDNNVGMGRLWQQHLMKLPSVTLETAETIMSVYPSPKSLMDAFRNSPDPEGLLKDIPFRRMGGPLSSNRRLGPEMSRKIHQFYSSLNGTESLSN